MTAEPVETVLFDLDGTLVDTPGAIATELVDAVRATVGRTVDATQARNLIGLPLADIAAELGGVSPASEDATRITDAYLDRYRTRIVPEASRLVFDGVRDGLAVLCGQGLKLAVVTSKYHQSAVSLLEAAGLDRFFDVVVGSDDTGRPKPFRDPAVLALDRLTTAPAAAVMVGDAVADLAMAANVPMRSIGVTYGVGLIDDLTALSPIVVADRFDDVIATVLDISQTPERTRL